MVVSTIDLIVLIVLSDITLDIVAPVFFYFRPKCKVENVITMHLLKRLAFVVLDVGAQQQGSHFQNLSKTVSKNSSKCELSYVFMKRYASSMFSKILTHSEKKTVAVPPDIMYDVVSDVSRYKDFVPWCTKSIVTSKTSKTAKAQLAVGFGPVQERYNSTLVLNKPRYIKSICTDGRLFNMLDCTWKFAEGKTPSTCVISFDVEFEFRSLVYTRLAKMFFDEVVKKMVIAFEARARQQYLLEKLKKKS